MAYFSGFDTVMVQLGFFTFFFFFFLLFRLQTKFGGGKRASEDP